MDDPRAAFAEALSRLRAKRPDLSDEFLARRAGNASTPSGRRAPVNARRLGEWLRGRSVPHSFDAVLAVVRALEEATGGPVSGGAPPSPVAYWRDLWQAAVQHRKPAAPAESLAIGHPPSDAAALRSRPELAAAVDDESVRQVVLTGAGGVGKTQLAVAAFHRARHRGGLRVWVPAGARQTIVATYARAWRALNDAGPGAGDDETQAGLFLDRLRDTAQRWLIVLDDVDDPAEVHGLWPTGTAGRTIVTTRRRDAAVLRPGARAIDVLKFTPAEAIGYLRDRLALESAAPADHTAEDELRALAEALGCYPLALSQAAAVLIDTGSTVAAYRRLLADRRETLAGLLPASSPGDEYAGTVATTWTIAVERADALLTAGSARSMLELVATLQPDGTRAEILLAPAACRWAGTSDDREAGLVLRALHRLSLLTYLPSAQPPRIEVHALLQRAVRETVPAERVAALAVAAADALNETWDGTDEEPDLQDALFRNVVGLHEWHGEHLWAGGMHPVLRRPLPYLIDSGRDATARELGTGLLAVARTDRDVLYLRAEVARAEGDMGSPEAARLAMEEVRREAAQLLGPDDHDTLWAQVHAARLTMETGALGDALAAFAAVAERSAAALGPEHPVTVLARFYEPLCRGLTGDAEGARDRAVVLVDEFTRMLGAEHPATLRMLIEVARWTGETGDVDGAVATFDRSVRAHVATLGPLHHDTLAARHNLAYWRALAGQVDLAVAELAAATRDGERALGADHPSTLTFRCNLAYWRGRSGDPEGLAELTAAGQDVARVLGADHPRMLRVRQQCAELARDRTRLEAVIADMIRVQGADHPRTREARDLLAGWS